MSVAKTREPETARPISLSFEFFPPKSDEQAAALDETVGRLSRFRPTYVSVTYGAGGTSQDRSLGTVRRMHELGLATAAHLTCAASTRDALAHTIGLFREIGIERFVALRGDPPGGLTIPYEPHPLGYRDTSQLVETLKLAGATEVSVSAYPEKHPQSADWDAEIGALRRKVDAGADRAITQFFYDNDLFERYVEAETAWTFKAGERQSKVARSARLRILKDDVARFVDNDLIGEAAGHRGISAKIRRSRTLR